jgi:hypothetical protein
MLETSLSLFSSIAQTAAAASALLVAIAIIQLQYYSNLLHDMQTAIARLFYENSLHADYCQRAFLYYLDDEWEKYITEVRAMAQSGHVAFQPSQDYVRSREYLGHLVERGSRLLGRYRRLHAALFLAFVGTLFFAGTGILAIPTARWVTERSLIFIWVGSGAALLALFLSYAVLAARTRPIRKMGDSP